MTTTVTEVRGPQPTDVDLAQARANLRAWQAADHDFYAHLAGVHDCLLELIADAHTECRKPGCLVCMVLRRATAIRIAYKETR